MAQAVLVQQELEAWLPQCELNPRLDWASMANASSHGRESYRLIALLLSPCPPSF